MLLRFCTITNVRADTTVADSTSFDFRNFSGGMVFVPAGSGITVLTWYGSHDGITFLPIEDGSGTAVTSTFSSSAAAAKACLIPAACFAAAFLKIKATTEDGLVDISLKS